MYRSPSHHEFAGTTGGQFQEEFVGSCRLAMWRGEYVKYAVAMNMARMNQPKDALHQTGVRLRDLIAQKIGVSSDAVKFFTALGTPLDHWHGVDAFIETTAFPGVTVTVDFTLSAKAGYKARVIVSQEDVLTDFSNAVDAIVSAFRRPPLRA